MRRLPAGATQLGSRQPSRFDASKENICIISNTDPAGEPFKILGVLFDTKLKMIKAIHDCAMEAAWKVKSLLRTRRYHSLRDMVNLFKANVLSFLEYRTAAFYHACTTSLDILDKVLPRFLAQLGISAKQAFLEFNLAPLSMRRDVAMLGLIHRCVIGEGPPHFQPFFQLCGASRTHVNTRRNAMLHSKQLVNPLQGRFLEIARRSALGLVTVYNYLPQELVDRPTVKDFQRQLQGLAKDACRQNFASWEQIYSPRVTFYSHPLLKFRQLMS